MKQESDTVAPGNTDESAIHWWTETEIFDRLHVAQSNGIPPDKVFPSRAPAPPEKRIAFSPAHGANGSIAGGSPRRWGSLHVLLNWLRPTQRTAP